MSHPPPTKRHPPANTGVFSLLPEAVATPHAGQLADPLSAFCDPGRCAVVLLSSPVNCSSVAIGNPGARKLWELGFEEALLGWLSPIITAQSLAVPESIRKSLSCFQALAMPICSPFERFGVAVFAEGPALALNRKLIEAVVGDFALQLEVKRRKALVVALRTAMSVANCGAASDESKRRRASGS